jgi:hypothetical protein
MQHNNRRVLLHPSYVEGFRNALREAKADLHQQHFEHLCRLADQNVEIADLRAEVAELREILALLVTISRQQAETDVATLRAQLMALLVRLQRRDPTNPLH